MSLTNFRTKIHRRSTSHSAVMSRELSPEDSSAVPNIKFSTRGPSGVTSPKVSTRTHSPLPSRVDLWGASRTTGGLFRGRALGSEYNFADAGMSIPI